MMPANNKKTTKKDTKKNGHLAAVLLIKPDSHMYAGFTVLMIAESQCFRGILRGGDEKRKKKREEKKKIKLYGNCIHQNIFMLPRFA